MDAKELWEYFKETEHYSLKQGKAMEGFIPNWIGEFYAYYQWYYNIPSAEVNQKINVDFLKNHITDGMIWIWIQRFRKLEKYNGDYMFS